MLLTEKRIFQRQCKKLILYIFLIVLCPALSVAANISYEISPREITVGDPVELILRLNVNESAKIHLPTEQDFDPAELIRIDTLQSVGSQRIYSFTISVFEPGNVQLEDLPVVIEDGESFDTLWFDPGTIDVITVILPEDSLADIRDIRPPIKLSISWRDILPYLIGALVLAVVGFIMYYYWRKWNRKQTGQAAWTSLQTPPYEKALQELENLRLKRLWQNGYIKEYYTELVDIIKHYISGRYSFPASEMTSWELISNRSKWANETAEFDYVNKIITCGDLVKFAKFKPQRQEHEECMDAGFAYLKSTKPEEAIILESGKMHVVDNVGEV